MHFANEALEIYKKHIGEDKSDEFVFIDIINQNNIKIYVYKHKDTGLHLHIGEDGNFYRYNCFDDNYKITTKEKAWNWVLRIE